MSDIGYWNNRDHRSEQGRGLPPDGRWAIALGLVALMIGFGAMAGGAYLGLGISTRLIALPGGLPATPSETVAIIVASCGAVTTLLGIISLYKAHDA